jgi:transcriptional regulator with XRE-family HTH domain
VSEMKKLRNLSGLSLRQLGNLCKMDPSKLSVAENGLTKLSDADTAVVRRKLLQAITKRAAEINHILRAEEPVETAS